MSRLDTLTDERLERAIGFLEDLSKVLRAAAREHKTWGPEDALAICDGIDRARQYLTGVPGYTPAAGGPGGERC